MRGMGYIQAGQRGNQVGAKQGFVRPFQERGVELVLFFDGQVCLSKAADWRKRRQRRLQDIEGRLEARMWTGKNQEDYRCPNGTSLTLFAAKCLTTCMVSYSLEECDIEATRYAEVHPECFALLGQDTDFVMFNTRVLYLSTLYLDTRTLKTQAYHCGALARHLGFTPAQLPLFACLAGNDTVGLDALQPFHRSIGCGPEHRVRFQWIADVMREFRWSGVPDASVAARVNVDLALLKESVSLYDLTSPPCRFESSSPHMDWDCWFVVASACKEAYTLPALLQVLYTGEVYLGETMEQQIGPSIPPAHLCFRPVRRKMYWVLFGGREHLTVTEHVAYPGGTGIRDEVVTCLAAVDRGRPE